MPTQSSRKALTATRLARALLPHQVEGGVQVAVRLEARRGGRSKGLERGHNESGRNAAAQGEKAEEHHESGGANVARQSRRSHGCAW